MTKKFYLGRYLAFFWIGLGSVWGGAKIIWGLKSGKHGKASIAYSLFALSNLCDTYFMNLGIQTLVHCNKFINNFILNNSN